MAKLENLFEHWTVVGELVVDNMIVDVEKRFHWSGGWNSNYKLRFHNASRAAAVLEYLEPRFFVLVSVEYHCGAHQGLVLVGVGHLRLLG